MRVRLLLAYDGTNYRGWQIQAKPQPPPTIQGAVETALFSICGAHIRAYGAGRTDAGVHAHGQTAHFDGPERLASLDWRHALNALLPSDIRVLEAAIAHTRFHARDDAISKTYVYDFWPHNNFPLPRLRPYVWECGHLDGDAMRAALPRLAGCHDFASFQNVGTEIKDTRRHIFRMELRELAQDEFYPHTGSIWRLIIEGNGFLKQMARNLAGFLVAVGKGVLDASRLDDILAARDRRALPSATAPARGLALARVEYPALNRREIQLPPTTKAPG